MNLKSQVGIAGGQHRGETRHFLLAAAFFARLFKRPAGAHNFQRALAVNFFLQAAQRAFHGLAFFQFNFGQRNSHPFRGETVPHVRLLAELTVAEDSFSPADVNAQKRRLLLRPALLDSQNFNAKNQAWK